MRPQVKVLIIDLDNTIYDWFAIWYASFIPVYEGLTCRLGGDVALLEQKIRNIHQARRTSEYTFLVDELDVSVPEGMKLREFLKEELTESRVQRDRALKLYPGVLRTLWEAKNAGTRIVAYTESLSFYSAYRLKRLGLDGVIDFLYSPEDHDMPAGVSLSDIRNRADEHYELLITKVRHTPAGEIKPNPKLLLQIVGQQGVEPNDCIYVGDTLFKDVTMAQQAGVHDVYAEYGVVQHKKEYELLRRVSHWTDEDVQREKQVSKAHVEPTISIECFSEITKHFEFSSFLPTKESAKIEHVIDVWKKVVEVQQHFNQIEIQIRNFALTVTGAIMAAAGITFRDNLQITVFGIDIRLASALALFGLAVWGGFWFMDRHWYHRLLKGATNHIQIIEKKYCAVVPEIALGTSISEASPLKIWRWTLNSNKKINLFYGIGVAVIILFAAGAGLGQHASDRGTSVETPAGGTVAVEPS